MFKFVILLAACVAAASAGFVHSPAVYGAQAVAAAPALAYSAHPATYGYAAAPAPLAYAAHPAPLTYSASYHGVAAAPAVYKAAAPLAYSAYPGYAGVAPYAGLASHAGVAPYAAAPAIGYGSPVVKTAALLRK